MRWHIAEWSIEGSAIKKTDSKTDYVYHANIHEDEDGYFQAVIFKDFTFNIDIAANTFTLLTEAILWAEEAVQLEIDKQQLNKET